MAIKYVAPDGLGDNGAAGDIGTPWSTLTYAVTQITSGDTIYMQVGTHTINTTVTVPIGISILGAGDTSIITTTVLSTEWDKILNLSSGSIANGNQSISYLKFDGGTLTGAMAIDIRKRNGVIIHHCTFIDFMYSAIYWTGDGGDAVTAPTNYVTGCQFYNNTVTNCSAYSGGYARGALYLGGLDGLLIYNNTITQTGRTAGTNGWPIKIQANGGWVKGMKIYNNTLFKDDLTNWDFCIEGFWHQGVEIYGNTITGSVDLNHGEKETYAYSAYIHNNTIGPETATAGAWDGIVLEFSWSDAIIRYNRIRNCKIGVYWTPRLGNTVTNTEISYNLFEDLGKGGNGSAGLRVDNLGWDLSNLFVYNNVFYSDVTNPCPYGILTAGDNVTNINIINNIFVNFSSYWLANRIEITDLNIKNNILYNNANTNDIRMDVVPINYVYSDNIEDNPDFTGANNYTLQAGSPAINSGINVGLTTDYLGYTVPFGIAPDIGAYEDGSSLPLAYDFVIKGFTNGWGVA